MLDYNSISTTSGKLHPGLLLLECRKPKACKCLLVQERRADAERRFQRHKVRGVFQLQIPGDDTAELEFLGKLPRFICDSCR